MFIISVEMKRDKSIKDKLDTDEAEKVSLMIEPISKRIQQLRKPNTRMMLRMIKFLERLLKRIQ